MKALVVYDSAYGNTEQIAQAIGRALSAAGDATVLRAGDVRPEHLRGLSLLVVGSPTQKFSPLGAVTRFLKGIPPDGLRGVRVAAFDTRITPAEIAKVRILAFFVRLFGYAAEPIGKRLAQKGGELALPPEGFFVAGMEGPLLEGELERAAAWAGRVAAAMGVPITQEGGV